MRWLQRIWAGLPRWREPAWRVEASDRTLRLYGDEQLEREFAWGEVRRIETFKLDLFTVDCICLRFHLHEGKPVTIGEDATNFVDLIGVLEDHFGVGPHWYMQVMLPPFETNLQIIWQESEPAAVSR